jgi:ketosteroid isomerase-like protein
MNWKPGVLLTILVAGSAACSDRDASGDLANVRAQAEAYFAALMSDDPTAATALRVDDVVQMPPSSRPRTSSSAIEAVFSRFRASNDHTVVALIDDIQLSGDLAVTRATFEQTIIPKIGDDTTVVTGSWLLVWRRQPDGAWKMTTEVWTNHPPD